MTWEDQHTRIDIMHTVLARAAIDPHRPDLFDGLPDLDRLFGGQAGLLLALRNRWNVHLEAKLDEAYEQGRPELEAYLELCAEQPELHALLEGPNRRHPSASEAMAR
ncbi:hypothetical protein [Nocardia cyriacigeorgica]|uniref:Uncharacterized protein n=1 Tax=Nocardia cyriacigeorgica TaxID=135487 RepID=A0A5R8NU15_9NOCA|nr:hypothetical protein [Nocardia cyriacigeorgica]TLF79213.1 hypothetical protein FEK34_07340 [Nocardia cyriacigeorgica]TLF97887.1 hypothetical protein FEK35_26410 [Nocardia cyriacigeorgica]